MAPTPPGTSGSPERREWRAALLTFGPSIVVAFVLERVLTTGLAWPARRALWTSIAVGIVLALVLQHIVARRHGRGVGK